MEQRTAEQGARDSSFSCAAIHDAGLEIDGAALATEENSVWIAALGIFWLERRAKINGLKRQYPRRVRLGMRSALSVPHLCWNILAIVVFPRTVSSWLLWTSQPTTKFDACSAHI
jgi:hypothetical protein